MARNVVVGGAVGGCAHVFSVDACLCLRVEAIAFESVVGIHSESHDLPRIGSDGNGRVAGLVVDGELFYALVAVGQQISLSLACRP